MANLVCVCMCVIVAGRHVAADMCVLCARGSATSRCVAAVQYTYVCIQQRCRSLVIQKNLYQNLCGPVQSTPWSLTTYEHLL